MAFTLGLGTAVYSHDIKADSLTGLMHINEHDINLIPRHLLYQDRHISGLISHIEKPHIEKSLANSMFWRKINSTRDVVYLSWPELV